MIAAERVRNPGLLDVLRRWAEAKYSLPWTHSAFQQLDVFELLIMFWEDYYEKNPMESRRTADGKVVFSNTGDALIDKWEQELAEGLMPDLLDGVSQEERQAEAKALEKLKAQQGVLGNDGDALSDGFSDDYELEGMNLPVLGS